MWAQGVEVVDEGGDDGFGVSQGSEAMKPSTLFLEGANEAFAKAVLLRGIRSGVFLNQAVVLDEGAVMAGTENQPIVVAKSQRTASGTVEPAKAAEKSFLKRAFGGFGTSGRFKRPTQDFASAAIDDRNKGTPAVDSTIDHGNVGGPSPIRFGSCGREGLNAGSAASSALADRPPLQVHDAVDRLSIDGMPEAETQPGPHAPNTKGRELFDDRMDQGGEFRITGPDGGLDAWTVVSRRSGKPQDAAKHADGHGPILG